MIIGIAGLIGSGKDTVAECVQALDVWYNQYGGKTLDFEGYNDIKFVKEILEKKINNDIHKRYSSWSNKKFAKKLKQVLAIIFDVNEKQFENIDFKNTPLPIKWQTEANGNKTYRDALTYIGTECMQKWDKDIWVKALFNQYKHTDYDYPNCIISDVRFLHEINAIKVHEGCLIRVDRTPKDGGFNHVSEFEWQKYDDWDFIIDNNGNYEYLIIQVRDIMAKLGLIIL